MTVAALRRPDHVERHRPQERRGAVVVARVGILARGVIHLLVGWLAVRIAAGDVGEQADHRGALQALARQPLGRWLLVAMGAGFLAYAAWRAMEAVLDTEDKGAVQRVGQALRAVLYVAMASTAFAMAFTAGNSTGTGSEAFTARMMATPAGRWVVIAAALTIIGVGVWNGSRAVTRSFTKRIKQVEMSPAERLWTIRAGVAGHLARMVAYLVVGWFLLRAAWTFDPRQPIGLDASLHALALQPWGRLLLLCVGAGVIVFGLYQAMLARYREVLDS